MQKLMLSGNLTKDAEKKEFDNNDLIVFTVADNSNDYFDKEGQKVKQPEFFRCELNTKKEDGRFEYLQKGKYVSLNGRIKTTSYGEDDNKKYTSSVIVDGLEIVWSNEK